MKFLLSFLAFTWCCDLATAQTSISGPTVSGHWAVSGSPYLINSDIYIPGDSTLTIDPGVEVRFNGHYRLSSAGALKAMGTAAAPITFHAADTTGWYNDAVAAGGWKGLYFQMYSDTGCVMEYCNISDCKYGADTSLPTSTGTITAYKLVKLSHCNIFHNQSLSPLSIQAIITLSQMDGVQVVDNCTIHDNKATWSVVDYSNGGTLGASFTNNEVYNNTSNYNVWLKGVTGVVEGNNLHNNRTSLQGGALNIAANAVLSVKGNKIHHNVAENVGSVVCLSSTIDLNGNLICNNYSLSAVCGLVDGGGGVQLSGNGSGTANAFMVRNNVIANNRTEFNGGGINLIYANAEILNNTIVNNSAHIGGGIYMMDNAQVVNIKNNIMYGNDMPIFGTMTHAPGVYVFNGYQISYNNNWAEHSYADNFYIVTAPSIYGDTTHNVIDSFPLLAAPTSTNSYTEDATTADFSLQATSPCIDAGDTTGAAPYTTDYAGNPRIAGNHIDIGAYERVPGSGTNGVAIQSARMEEMVIFPVPAHDVVNIAMPAGDGNIEITDLSGRTILCKKVTAKLQPVDISQLAAGEYIVKWTGANNTIATQKVIKQ